MRVTNFTLFTLPARLAATVLILSCAATAVHAQMYKWVDENGAVTYTNVPPPQAKSRGQLELIVPQSATVSTYSSAESLGKAGFTNYERVLKERVTQLERDLEAERQARSQASESQASKAAQRRKELRERCLADRRVDCDRADLEESHAIIAVVRAPVIRQVIVQPVVIRAAVPQRTPHQPHPERRHSDTTQHAPSQLTVTFGMPSKPATTTGQRWRY